MKASMFHYAAVYLGFANIRIIQNFIAVNAETDSTKRIQPTTSISWAPAFKTPCAKYLNLTPVSQDLAADVRWVPQKIGL